VLKLRAFGFSFQPSTHTSLVSFAGAMWCTAASHLLFRDTSLTLTVPAREPLPFNKIKRSHAN